MVLWGAFWGALVGWITGGYWDEAGLVVGAILGSIAGLTLRRSVRTEFSRLQQQALEQRLAPPADPRLDTAEEAFEPYAATATPEPVVDIDVERGVTVTPMPATPDLAMPLEMAERSTVADMPLYNNPEFASAKPVTSQVPAATQPVFNVNQDLPPPEPVEPGPVERAVAALRDWFFGGNMVARVGALMLFIGLAFLAKWAADNSLFPPEARLAGIAVVGIALLVQGARMSATAGQVGYHFNYGVLLQGLGVAVLYLAIFAAFKLYALLPASLAFALMLAVCALSSAIALLRNAQALAFVGFAGAFATPMLLSDGSGSHVSLFAYYLLLNLAILALAFWRPWRALNLLGFFATFGVATAWGALRYQPALYTSTQPFLLAFFLIYLIIGLLYALRHSAERKHPVDASLVFGTPVAALALQIALVEGIEYGAAFSALIAGALYIVLGFVLNKRLSTVKRWLVQSYAAIGLLLVTLAVPLALEQRVTAAVWALEGAAIYWLSRQQGNAWGRVFGVLMQVVAGAMMLNVLDARNYYAYDGTLAMPLLPFANADFLSALLLAAGALLISWWSRRDEVPADGSTGSAATLQHLSVIASVALFVIGFFWAWYGLWSQLEYRSSSPLDSNALHALRMLGFVALVVVATWAARRFVWRGASLAAYIAFPVVLCGMLIAVTASWSWLILFAWALTALAYLWVLQQADRAPPLLYWRVVHTGNVLLLLLLLGRSLAAVADWADLWNSDWYAIAGVFSLILVLMLLSRAGWWQDEASHWPLNRFRRDYLLHAGSGVAVLVGLSTLATACLVRGDVRPLPYLPLLNPVDLTVLLGLASLALWRLRIQQADWIADTSPWKLRAGWVAIAALGFVVANTIWLRVAHHFFAVRWDAEALATSFVVQAGYSVLWTVLALLAMVGAHRSGRRLLWQVGAGLLAVTVVKMLLVDLANSGGGERIVAFIVVGALMVAVGYFAPMPPTRKVSPAEAIDEN